MISISFYIAAGNILYHPSLNAPALVTKDTRGRNQWKKTRDKQHSIYVNEAAPETGEH